MPSESLPGAEDDPQLVVRPATAADADALATLFLAAREAAYPAIPRPVHPPEDVRRWVHGWFADTEVAREVWLAEEDGVPVAVLLLEDAWLHSLYVEPARTGEGIGSALLDLAKSRRPHRLGLWVFQTNQRARRFYLRHGFVEVRRTDGTGPDGNEEGEPDVELAWPATHRDPRSSRR
jgi:GNAT superfamily N-acetyltransferase